jgi:hypothetical protein
MGIHAFVSKIYSLCKLSSSDIVTQSNERPTVNSMLAPLLLLYLNFDLGCNE